MSIKENRRGRHFLFGYFFFVAGDKEKVTFQPQMLWFNSWPIKQRRRLFTSLAWCWGCQISKNGELMDSFNLY